MRPSQPRAARSSSRQDTNARVPLSMRARVSHDGRPTGSTAPDAGESSEPGPGLMAARGLLRSWTKLNSTGLDGWAERAAVKAASRNPSMARSDCFPV